MPCTNVILSPAHAEKKDSAMRFDYAQRDIHLNNKELFMILPLTKLTM